MLKNPYSGKFFNMGYAISELTRDLVTGQAVKNLPR